MADYLQNVEDMYNKLYKAKQQALQNDTTQKLAGLDSQQNALANQYQELQNTLNARKQATQGQYQQLYNGLDNQLNQGKEQYYNDRNSAALSNAQRMQQIRDYMAKSNLMASGENVDAMLKGNTDYNNNLGNIYSQEKQFTRGIGDKRNAYSLEEQNAYNDINNQLGAADREKAQKIADILNQRNLLNNSMVSDLQAYKDQLDAEKIKDINNYNMQQQQYRASQAKASASTKSKNALSNTMSAGSTYNKEVANINDIVNGQYNLSEKERVLQSYISDKESQNGNEAAALAKYAQQALDKVKQQMSDWVNAGRYAGM